MGHEIKVEQQGAMGQVNPISKERSTSSRFCINSIRSNCFWDG